MEIYVNHKRVRISAKNAIGKGGEADVFKLNRHTALKVFKPPDHPDFVGMPEAQQAAGDRLDQHQQKLRQFPQALPSRVISPQKLATDKQGQRILGYTMPLLKDMEVLLKYGDRTFRRAIATQTVVQIFQDLHQTLTQLHQTQVVIGDFNDLNVLVNGTEAYVIDADSFQFGAFPCSMFTARFVDPLLCDDQAHQLILQQKHTPNSDWYAFTVMLMQCLLFVDPYGGIYKPKEASQRLPHSARPLHRITVFHPEVRYPKPALPYDRLSDDLLHHFHRVFEQDWRGEFPRSLLDTLHWTTCTTCGIDHARPQCPNCTPGSTTRSPTRTSPSGLQTEIMQGQVTVTPILNLEGLPDTLIVYATAEAGHLRWIVWEQGQFKREDGVVILEGSLQPNVRWRIQGQTTLIGQQGQVVSLQNQALPQRFTTERYGQSTQFDANTTHRYWISQGQLLRDTSLNHTLAHNSSTVIGSVLPGGHTQIWIGETFGFGFYRAGDLTRAFVFDTHRPGINDQVTLPPWRGQLIYATCTFNPPAKERNGDRAWLFLTTQDQGMLNYHCVVLAPDGRVMAIAHAHQDQEHWLTHLGQSNSIFLDPCPYCAVGDFLLAATDAGIIRIDLQNGHLHQTKTFPDTEPFVNATSRLLPAPSGLYVINNQTIQQVQIK